MSVVILYSISLPCELIISWFLGRNPEQDPIRILQVLQDPTASYKILGPCTRSYRILLFPKNLKIDPKKGTEDYFSIFIIRWCTDYIGPCAAWVVVGRIPARSLWSACMLIGHLPLTDIVKERLLDCVHDYNLRVTSSNFISANTEAI